MTTSNSKKKIKLNFLNKLFSSINNWSKTIRVMFYSGIIGILTIVFFMRYIFLLKVETFNYFRIITKLLFKLCPFFNAGEGESCGWLVFGLDIIVNLILYIILFIFILNIKISNKTRILITYSSIGYLFGLLRILLTLNTIPEYEFGFTKDVILIILLFPFGYVLLAIMLGIIIKGFKSKDYIKTVISIILFLILASYVFPYKVEQNMTVHQHITKEASKVWKLIHFEIKNHTNSEINVQLDSNGYQNDEDAIIGSGEEDEGPEIFPFRNHFWNPDSPNVPNNGSYNNGLDAFGVNLDSSYTKAKNLWTENVIKNYLKGNINESYYWLGRVAHLLEDASQPSHVLLDCHMDKQIGRFICSGSLGDNGSDDSVLEEYTGRNFTTLRNTNNWTGSNFTGQQYNYERLPNIENLNWKEIEPTYIRDKQNIELFRIFWYTAQKTQYFASDDVDGNTIYVNLSGSTKNFSISLWNGENVTFIDRADYLRQDDINDDGPNVSAETNAMIPHSMKAVAGLYRLFWDAVRIDWPTESHDNQRTGFTLLKGDLVNETILDTYNFVLATNISQESVLRSVIADIDNNGYTNVITYSHDPISAKIGSMYSLETKSVKKHFLRIQELNTTLKWRQDINESILQAPSLGNIDEDIQKEIVVALRNGTIVAFDISSDGYVISNKWNFTTNLKFSVFTGTYERELGGGTAIEDINLDEINDVILIDYGRGAYDWPGEVYIINGTTGKQYASATFGNGGGFGAVSVANIDEDDYPEIIVPSQYGIYVYKYNISINNLSLMWNNSDKRITNAIVLKDIDYDNNYELIYTSTSYLCATAKKPCYNRTYIVDAKTGEIEKSINQTFIVRITASAGNIDNDSIQEIILITRNNNQDELGKVICYDSSTFNQDCLFDEDGNLRTAFVSPSVVDIDNDGIYDVIFGENNGTKIFVNKGNGQNYTYNSASILDDALAIADVDGDSYAEIVFRRSSSPITILSSISNVNEKPNLNNIRNITAIAGFTVNINATGDVTATDPNGDQLTYYYSSPFNSSGSWKTTINDSGNSSILIEVSDGTLSDFKTINVQILNYTFTVVNNLTDGSNQKTLSFTNQETKTIQIRVPRNVSITHTQLKLEGKSS